MFSKIEPSEDYSEYEFACGTITILGLHRVELVRFIIPLLSIATILNYGSQAKATDSFIGKVVCINSNCKLPDGISGRIYL